MLENLRDRRRQRLVHLLQMIVRDHGGALLLRVEGADEPLMDLLQAARVAASSLCRGQLPVAAQPFDVEGVGVPAAAPPQSKGHTHSSVKECPISCLRHGDRLGVTELLCHKERALVGPVMPPLLREDLARQVLAHRDVQAAVQPCLQLLVQGRPQQQPQRGVQLGHRTDHHTSAPRAVDQLQHHRAVRRGPDVVGDPPRQVGLVPPGVAELLRSQVLEAGSGKDVVRELLVVNHH
mmetsp:Transcript_89801/g.267902  ORF Transcript_89801/g.267902 Transcript_89801/m.267902 type:complete len:236 (-) Transcript_89801:175-882(-)